MKNGFNGKLQILIDSAEIENKEEVDCLMIHLTIDQSYAMMQFIDHARLNRKYMENFTCRFLILT